MNPFLVIDQNHQWTPKGRKEKKRKGNIIDEATWGGIVRMKNNAKTMMLNLSCNQRQKKNGWATKNQNNRADCSQWTQRYLGMNVKNAYRDRNNNNKKNKKKNQKT